MTPRVHTGNFFFPWITFAQAKVCVASGVTGGQVQQFAFDMATGELELESTFTLPPGAYGWGFIAPGLLVYGRLLPGDVWERHTLTVPGFVDTVVAEAGPDVGGFFNVARDRVWAEFKTRLLVNGAPVDGPAVKVFDTRDGYVFYAADGNQNIIRRLHVATGDVREFATAGTFFLVALDRGEAIAQDREGLFTLVGRQNLKGVYGGEVVVAGWTAGFHDWFATNWWADNGRGGELTGTLLRPVNDPANVIRLPGGAEACAVIEVGDWLVIARHITVPGSQAQLTVEAVRRDMARAPLPALDPVPGPETPPPPAPPPVELPPPAPPTEPHQPPAPPPPNPEVPAPPPAPPSPAPSSPDILALLEKALLRIPKRLRSRAAIRRLILELVTRELAAQNEGKD